MQTGPNVTKVSAPRGIQQKLSRSVNESVCVKDLSYFKKADNNLPQSHFFKKKNALSNSKSYLIRFPPPHLASQFFPKIFFFF